MSGSPLRDLCDRVDEPIPLQLLKLHVGLLILTTELDLSTLYVYKLCLVKASEDFEHETVIVTVQCPGSESQWELPFNMSQCGSPHDPLNTLPLDNPGGDTSQVADSNLQSFKYCVNILVTFLYPYSALAKQDAIGEIHFPIPSPSPLGSQVPEPHGPKGYMQEKKPLHLISFINLMELLLREDNLFSPNYFWTLFRACAARNGIPSDLQDHQGNDFHTPGSYKHIPIIGPLLEEKLDKVISKWKMANQEFVDSQVSKSSAHALYCANFFHLSRLLQCTKLYRLWKREGEMMAK